MAEVQDQGGVKTVDEICKDSSLADGKYKLISGTLLPEKNPYDLKSKRLIATRSCEEDPNRQLFWPAYGWFKNMTPKDKEFYLCSQQKGDEKTRIKVNTDDMNSRLLAFNTHQERTKRRWRAGNHIHFFGLQSSTLTLLGVLDYDVEHQQFKLSKLGAFIAGNLNEAKAMLDNSIESNLNRALSLAFLCGYFAFCAYFLYSTWKDEC